MTCRHFSAFALACAIVAMLGAHAPSTAATNEIGWTSCDGGAPRTSLPPGVGDARMRAEYAQFARGGTPPDLRSVVAAMRSGGSSPRPGEEIVRGLVTSVRANGFTLARAVGRDAPYAASAEAPVTVALDAGAVIALRASAPRPQTGMSVTVIGRMAGGALHARVVEDAEATAEVTEIARYTSCNPVVHHGTVAECTDVQLEAGTGPSVGPARFDAGEREEIEDLVGGKIGSDLAAALASYRLHPDEVERRSTIYGIAERASGADVLVRVERDPLFPTLRARASTAPHAKPGDEVFVHQQPGAYAIHHAPIEIGETLRVGGKRSGNAIYATYVVDDRLDDVLFAAQSASRVCNAAASAFALPAWRIARAAQTAPPPARVLAASVSPPPAHALDASASPPPSRALAAAPASAVRGSAPTGSAGSASVPRQVAAAACYVTLSGRVVDSDVAVVRIAPMSASDAQAEGVALGSDGAANVVIAPQVKSTAGYVQPAVNDTITFAGFVRNANLIAVGMSSSRSTIASAPCPSGG